MPHGSRAGQTHGHVVSRLLMRDWWRVGLLVMLAGLAGSTGCQHQAEPSAEPSAPPAPQVVLDYGNGWYHTASGRETVSVIAARYQRDADLVAQMNKTEEAATPAAGMKLYIPPTNNRAKAREVVTRVRTHPELIPQTPWLGGAQATLAAAQQAATSTTAPTTQQAAPAKPASSPANESTAGNEEHRHWWSARHQADAASTSTATATPTSGTTRTTQIAQTGAMVASAQAPTTYLWPTEGKVVTRFSSGWRSSCHGIEIAATEGAPVRATRAGRVVLAQPFMSYGNLIVIDHGDGYATAYGFNQTINVKGGDRVSQGQTIATVGRPSQGSASKLFFQVRRNAIPIDPMQVLK